MDRRYGKVQWGTAWRAKANGGSLLEAAVPMGNKGRGSRNPVTGVLRLAR
jgi:hypothetical protein